MVHLKRKAVPPATIQEANGENNRIAEPEAKSEGVSSIGVLRCLKYRSAFVVHRYR